MGTIIEMLATKKKVPPPAESAAVILAMASKDHEGACGEGCGCGDGTSGGCCSS